MNFAQTETQTLISQIVEQVTEKVLAAIQSNDDCTPNTVKELLENNAVLTTRQTAEVLNVSIPTINRWKKDNKLPFIQINGSIRYKVEDVKNILNL